MIDNVFAGIVARAEAAHPEREGDYINEIDGLRYCSICNTPKQCKVEFLGNERIVPCLCACGIKQQEKEAAQREAEKTAERRRLCFADNKFMTAAFENDDGKNSELTKVCRKYADKFSTSADWLLLYGDCGTGKSYGAACVCNALLDKGLSVSFATVSSIERELWSAADKSEIYNRLSRYDLLVLDDLGAERNTDYMSEIVFNVIDGRLNSGKPCIVTTNMSGEAFSNPKNIAEQRIYSRIFERSIPYHVKGVDRRFETLKATGKKRLNALLDN